MECRAASEVLNFAGITGIGLEIRATRNYPVWRLILWRRLKDESH